MGKRIVRLIVLILAVCLLSGCCIVHEWENATCVTPKTCGKCGKTDGSAMGHSWQDATCTTAQVCRTCGETGGKALGHKWIAATCFEPQVCEVCGVTEGRPLDHDWSEGSDREPRVCRTCETMEPLPLPANGEVFVGKGKWCGSELTIRSSTDSCCYIKLKDTDGNDVYSFFVRAGETVVAPVPNGMFYVYFAYGTDWYGPEYVFGPDTTYAKDDELSDFNRYTWEYTLYPSYGGNFSETPISEEEF